MLPNSSSFSQHFYAGEKKGSLEGENVRRHHNRETKVSGAWGYMSWWNCRSTSEDL